jgi:hypothetical protein
MRAKMTKSKSKRKYTKRAAKWQREVARGEELLARDEGVPTACLMWSRAKPPTVASRLAVIVAEVEALRAMLGLSQ